jgi:hypothetical protein
VVRSGRESDVHLSSLQSTDNEHGDIVTRQIWRKAIFLILRIGRDGHLAAEETHVEQTGAIISMRGHVEQMAR